MTDEEVKDFIQRVLDRISQVAFDKVQPLIPSRVLADALAVVAGETENQRFLQVPHYWAVYVHDGRGAFGPVRSEYLVWFRDKLDDPRTNFGQDYPIREGDIKRLSKEQFQYYLELNRQDRAAGLRPRMVIAKFQPKIMQGTPFFDEGLADLSREASREASQELASLLDDLLPDPGPGDQATFRL